MTILEIEVVYSGESEKQAPQYRKLQRGIKGVLAEWESDETSQRTYKLHRYRAQQSKWRGGNYTLWCSAQRPGLVRAYCRRRRAGSCGPDWPVRGR